ncbi:hypothetical protein [Streptomyces sp. NPDC003327]
MSLLAPDTFVTFSRGMDARLLHRLVAEAGRPVRAVGEDGGWAWVEQDAYVGPEEQGAAELARDLTGYRFRELVGGRAETVFLASTPACACPEGRYYAIPHCARHPFQFSHHRGGFEQLYLNLGGGRESRRGGPWADRPLREFLAAGLVGRETRYATEPGFNEDGAVALGVLVRLFGLPSAAFRGEGADPDGAAP